MSEQIVTMVQAHVPPGCLCTDQTCEDSGCSLSLEGTPTNRVVVDMNCDALKTKAERERKKRCDFLFVGKEAETVWAASIEMKSGWVDASVALEQLQEGANTLECWLPKDCKIQFVPVLAWNRKIHKRERSLLQRGRVQLRGQEKQAILIDCGDSLSKALT